MHIVSLDDGCLAATMHLVAIRNRRVSLTNDDVTYSTV